MGTTHTIDEHGIAEIVMDNPPVNALTVAGWFDLADRLRALGRDGQAIRGVNEDTEPDVFNRFRVPGTPYIVHSVDGVVVDVVCTGRFFDFFARRNGQWKIVRRQPIYEKDRMDPLDPAARLTIGKRLSDRVYLTYSRSLSSSTRDQIILLEYDQTDRFSWILSRNEDQTYALDVRVRHVF